MIQVDQWIQTEAPPVRMIMQVHDELVFEVTEDHLRDAESIIRASMVEASAGALSVPLEVEVGVGENWDEAH
jgi:DNA polymerase-1